MKKLLTIAALLAISICHGAQEDVVRTTKATGVVVNPALVNFPTGTLEVNGVAVTGGGALTSGTLAQFSATTSAEFAGVISDETGTGAVVLANSPVFITPTLGTVTSGNVDAILPASSLTVSGIIELATQGEVDTGADAVRAITPATLAGATDVIGIAHLSATGTPNGTTFLRGDNTWSAPAGAGDLLAANNLSDVANAPTSLSNLGGIGAATSDTLTNKSFNANDTGNVLTNVDVADLAGGTDGELITWDAAGVATTVAVGTAGQVLISAGPGSPPAFGAAGAGDLLAANNLSDVANASTSLSNLGGIGASTSDTLTNKAFNANGTGNVLSNVDVADLADATDGELITWSAAGVATTVSVGTVGQVLKSNGAGAAPSFQAGGGGGDLLAANNLSDVAVAATSLSNLGGIGAATSDTLTNKSFNANGTGNVLTNVDVADLANGTDGELITWSAAGVAATVGVGTVGQVLTSAGPGASPTFENVGAGATASFSVTAAAFVPTSTNPPAAGTRTVTTSTASDFLSYDDSTNENAIFTFSMPDDFDDTENVQFVVYWSSVATSGNVRWRITLGQADDIENFPTATGNTSELLDTPPASSDRINIGLTSTVLFSPLTSADEMLVLKMERNAALDTLSGDAKFYMLRVNYTKK